MCAPAYERTAASKRSVWNAHLRGPSSRCRYGAGYRSGVLLVRDVRKRQPSLWSLPTAIFVDSGVIAALVFFVVVSFILELLGIRVWNKRDDHDQAACDPNMAASPSAS